MDLLASLGLENALPEQSTRLTHPGVISALQTNSSECQLGFNCCLTCGASLLQQHDRDKSLKKKEIYCKGCNRVKYCSEVCRKVDAEPQQLVDDGGDDDDDVDEGALGHSPVICSLLNLCNGDETAEDNLYNTTTTTKNTKHNTIQKEEAAKYRVQTERESYPATLFNMLTDGPPWLIENLTRRLRYREEVRSPDAKGSGSSGGSETKRRGKRDRQSSSQEETASSSSGLSRELVLHIVGASVDSELWGWDGTTTSYTHNEMLDAYAEASTNVLSYLKNFIDSVDSMRLVFVGPDCPKPTRGSGGGGGDDDEIRVCRLDKSIPGSKTMLHIETHCCNYGEDTTLPDPDAIIFFNPGLSCTDYDWSKALSAASSYESSTPFLITTNTEMEGFADIKCLVDGGYVDSKELPTYILETVDVESPSNNSRYNDDVEEEEDDDEQNKKFFLCENPYAGLRVRQSGTMANDLYVKSRWVMGGLFQRGGDVVKKKKKKKKTKMVDKSKKKRKGSQEKGSDRKKRRKGGNPALI
eukprot:scaffold19821_cov166-Skeletonema_marinoi.AAC.13